jgi:hypothetical protein
MLQAYTYNFYQIGGVIRILTAGIPHQPLFDRQLPEDIKNTLAQSLPAILAHCESINLNLTAKHVRKMLAIPRNDYTYNKILAMLERLEELFEDELPVVQLKYVQASKVQLYQRIELFGRKVADNFPSASYDIEEAGKCLALERNTACVMHLMRVLEVAMDAVGLGIGIPDATVQAKNSWGQLLADMREKMRQNDKTADPTWIAKSAFFKEAHTYLASVKNAWRDTSMHLEKKYDEREAARIYRTIRDFMEHLAPHLDESGQFTP